MEYVIDLSLARQMIAELQTVGLNEIRLIDLIAWLLPVSEKQEKKEDGNDGQGSL